MANRTVILDAGVINQINKGNKQAAEKLREMLRIGSGVKVYLSDQAYQELTGQPGKLAGEVGPDLPRSAAANKRMIEDLQAMGLERAPAPPGGWDNAVKTYEQAAKG